MTRDNTLFEMGLFWGRLGRRRVFCIIPADIPNGGDKGPQSFHLPSDLDGLTLLRYTDNQKHASAVSAAALKVLEAIKREGLFKQRQEIINENGAMMERKNSILLFLWEYLRNVTVPDEQQRYNAYAEAVRNSILCTRRRMGHSIWKEEGKLGWHSHVFLWDPRDQSHAEGSAHLLFSMHTEWNASRALFRISEVPAWSDAAIY